MGWRLRKTFRIGKSFNINLSRRGIGWSFGIIPGLRYTVSPRRSRESRPTYVSTGTGCLVIAIASVFFVYVFSSARVANRNVPSRDLTTLQPDASRVAPNSVAMPPSVEIPASSLSAPIEAEEDVGKAVTEEKEPATIPVEVDRKRSARAKSLLASAKNLERAGKTVGAVQFYRMLTRELADTPEAKEAETRIKTLTGKAP